MCIVMDKLLLSTLIIVGLVVAILMYPLTTSDNGVSTPTLPDITSRVEELPVLNLGPGKPVVVYPGETFSVKFRVDPGNVVGGYTYMVKLVNNSLKLYNYTVTITGSGLEYNVTLPGNVEPGLYDLVVIGDQEYFIPRSVWVIGGLEDIISMVHMSDLHFGTGTPDVESGIRKRMSGLVMTQLLGPDMVINTGDEADTVAMSQYIESRAYRYSLLYPIPVFLNPGNHDWPNDNFIKYYGETTWYRLIGDKILLIALNTRGEVGYPDWNQLVWLTNVLEEYRNVSIKIIQMHHPVFYWQGVLNTTYNSSLITGLSENVSSPISNSWKGNITAAKYFLKLCEKYNVSIVFAGHIHRDQYVEYHSTWTNTTTYFITTTTLAHGTGTYNGLQYIELNTTKFNLSFPHAPPTFIGFKDHPKDSVFNSIHNSEQYFKAIFTISPNAYVFDIANNLDYLNFSNTILLALPWNGSVAGLEVVETSGNASVYLVDSMIVNNTLYIAIHIDLPRYSSAVFVIYNNPEDREPPVINLRLAMPIPPILNSDNRFYFDIIDYGWGLRSVDAKIIYMGQEFPVTQIAKYSDTTYLIKLRMTGNEPKTITLIVIAVDYANNTGIARYNITFYPRGETNNTPAIVPWPMVTETPTETQTTPIENTTSISTPTINQTTPITTPTTTTPTTSSPVSLTTRSLVRVSGEKDHTILAIIGFIAVAIALIIVASIAMRKK